MSNPKQESSKETGVPIEKLYESLGRYTFENSLLKQSNQSLLKQLEVAEKTIKELKSKKEK